MAMVRGAGDGDARGGDGYAARGEAMVTRASARIL